MGTKRINWSIEVRLLNHSYGNPALESEAIEAARQIERHVDVSSAIPVCDVVCEFCLTHWKDSVDGNGYPWCCEKAQKEADQKGIAPIDAPDPPATPPLGKDE